MQIYVSHAISEAFFPEVVKARRRFPKLWDEFLSLQEQTVDMLRESATLAKIIRAEVAESLGVESSELTQEMLSTDVIIALATKDAEVKADAVRFAINSAQIEANDEFMAFLWSEMQEAEEIIINYTRKFGIKMYPLVSGLDYKEK